MYKIATFYEFKPMGVGGILERVRDGLREQMRFHEIRGTMILAEEGFNATVSGPEDSLERFLVEAEVLLGTKFDVKFSLHSEQPFRRVDVKIKPEIVTLKQQVDISKGEGTHVSPTKWNELINSENVFVLDTRNDYEFRTGTFEGAVNPSTERFSELPQFVAANLDPAENKTIAMFCTGGIRCEKFAPYLKGLGFEKVFQLEGGILRYLEEVEPAESLWQGECFVFDTRTSVDHELRKGTERDHSQEKDS